MNKLLHSSMSLINIISTVLSLFPIQKWHQYKHFMRKIFLYSIASIFLIISCFFGYLTLYNYLVPYWGEALAALSLCLLSLIIALGIIMIPSLLRPQKKPPPPQILPLLEKSLDHIVHSKDLTKILKEASPKVLITVLGAVVIATCVLFCKKKNK